MRQILLNSNGALVARMPRPIVEAGAVLIRVHYSLVSIGTEIASLRPPTATSGQSHGNGATEVNLSAQLMRRYVGRALRNPRKAARKLATIAKHKLSGMLPARVPVAAPSFMLGELEWTSCLARQARVENGRLELLTDDSPAQYQVMSRQLAVPAGHAPVVNIQGTLSHGPVMVGVLDDSRTRWLASRTFEAGQVNDRLIVDPGQAQQITVVIANAGSNRAVEATFDELSIAFVSRTGDHLPLSELDDQGWNVGYSAAGVVLAVGDGITDLVPGDWVACGGAGQANHADYVCVKRNLVCRIPAGCDPRLAATTTVGAIALQGVRRARPQLGERVCVLGLGLIGQITAQLLSASGCTVLGMDLDPSRIERAKQHGMADGAGNADEFKKLVRDCSEGRGADRTLITAATKSDAVINLAMEVTRPKGTVVIVGDVGLNVQRGQFYRKEIDLLMSTSYGPGRYDTSYEEQGRDYPFAHVRWTMNRNMQAYMEAIAAKRIDVGGLIDREVPIDRAPAVYAELAAAKGELPLGVILHYPDDARPLPEPADAPRITVRGHKTPTTGPLQYALVGAGAFGTCMLVPQMEKRKDRFCLRGVVSRDAVRGGNFARANRVEVLATDLQAVLQDPTFDLVVISTRHHEHAAQTIAALKAGKHVFVEKPLALSWQELQDVGTVYESLEHRPLLMVGFNRRFSPAIRALQDSLQGRRSPLIMNYRLNGGYIPPDSWIQTSQGGGRNLGEACHMYDVFRCLAGAAVADIRAQAIHPGSLPYLRNDNFCATLTYEDGSVGNLVYTALGPKQGLGKERLEVFCDGEAYLLDDYKSLTRAGDGKVLWQAKEPDKGHFEELSQFGDTIAAGTEAPIPFDQIMETTAAALQVEDLIQGRIHDEDS
ncbi:MAG TPA: bi-domain-containing oxidoreductase [Gemmataceae bacterium]|nr:bi-domain-containing oxidoreductase [Gemmataceae bacterium]